jgi:rhamnosyltransferase
MMLKVKKCIIIVRYENNKACFIKNITEISKYYRIYVYDNSRESLELNINNIYYFHDELNNGLAVAINHCVDVALAEGIINAIYFDQDSKTNIELIDSLFNSYDYLQLKHNNIFAVGPQPVMDSGVEYPVRISKNMECNYFYATEIITSGMTFKLEDIKDIGYFDEDLYLDLVDFDICWRANKNNLKTIIDKNIKMLHEVGINTINVPFRPLPVSSPIRNYYQIRNILFVALHKEKKSLFIVLYYLLRKSVNISLNLIFADNRLLRLKYSYMGIRDAVLKKMGKLGE